MLLMEVGLKKPMEFNKAVRIWLKMNIMQKKKNT